MEVKFNPKDNEYDLMYLYENSYWWYKGLREILSYWINKINATTILDAGCGTGRNILELSNSTRQIYGRDISKKAVEYCAKQNLKNITTGSITKLPYQDKMFDCIYTMDVLGCLEPENMTLTINEFHRCLKKDGYLILNVAALHWLFSQHDLAWDIKKRYSKNELCEILTANGFTPVKATYRVFILFLPVLLVKLTEALKLKITKNAVSEGDLKDINPLLNSFFTLCMKMENILLRFVNAPIGSSLFVVARKN